MHAEVIAIGDEITSGQTLDTNSQWLSRQLEALGIRVLYHTTVADELDPCADVFRTAVDRADVVIATGGLGPTADDITRDALALTTRRELIEDPAAMEQIRLLFARRGRAMPPQNRRQALFPSGSRVLVNPHGTAPGIDLEVPRAGRNSCRVIVLPGVPAEMVEMWHSSVAGILRPPEAAGRVIVRRTIKCFGAGESHIESMLPDLIRRGRQPTVGITASKTTISLRIVAEGATHEQCQAAMEPTAATIYQSLGDLIFGEGDDELQDAVMRLLDRENRTLATAEWGTAGLVAQSLSSVAHCRSRYRGGVVVGDAESARSLLAVDAELAQGAPGEGLAAAMAQACRARLRADYGLAVGPFPPFHPAAPQPVFLALAGPDGLRHKSFPFAGHPDILTIYCAKQALNLVRLALECTAD